MDKKRCDWAKPNNALYVKYHDEEWGVPVYDDETMFEFLILESFQAGLSWEIVLKKRENFRRAFSNFDPVKVERFSSGKIEKLQSDASIIRNKLKINAAVNNARQFLKVQEEYGSFSNYIWDFVDGRPIQNRWKSLSDLPANTELSDKISKDLKKRGFKFMGSTVIYAHLQATGLINDHLVSCFRHEEVKKLSR